MYICWQNTIYILVVVLLKCGRGNRKSPPSSNTTYLPDITRVLFAAWNFFSFLTQHASTFLPHINCCLWFRVKKLKPLYKKLKYPNYSRLRFIERKWKKNHMYIGIYIHVELFCIWYELYSVKERNSSNGYFDIMYSSWYIHNWDNEIHLLIKYIKKRSLESSEKPFPIYRTRGA